MLIRVECHAGHRGEETPQRFFLGERAVEVDEVRDRWHGEDHRYFKVLGNDGVVYVLRHNERAGDWEMTMYGHRG